MERMENNRIAKRVYVGECGGSHSFGRTRKKWIHTVKQFMKKRFRCQARKENGAG